MDSSLSLVAAFGPVVLLLAAGTAPFGPRVAHVSALLASGAAFTVSVLAWLAVQIAGPVVSPTLLGLSLSLDPLSTTLAFLVTFVGVLVIRFSRQYLDGDPGQARFTAAMALTLAAVLTLVLSGNTVQLFVGWVGTSLALHRLLVFYRDRAGARRAAYKKFVVARLGDVALLGALVLLYQAYDTVDIATLGERAAAATQTPTLAYAAALLIAIAAMLKSAQFPTHGWLLEVMETPTPVSALLHAGIINAGGFLVVRFAPIVTGAPMAQDVLAVVGAVTAMFASLAMLTETRVKVSLAYSTIAQMGFMLLQCGLGAYALAVLHIVAHSLYKAHGFLTSGSVIEVAKKTPPGRTPKLAALIASALIGLGVFVGAALLANGIRPLPLPVLALGSVLVLGLTQYLALSGSDRDTVAVRAVLGSIAISALYFGFELAAEHAFHGALPTALSLSVFDGVLLMMTVLVFGAATVVQLVGGLQHPLMQSVHVHLRNGLYVDLIFDQLVGARRRNRERISSW